MKRLLKRLFCSTEGALGLLVGVFVFQIFSAWSFDKRTQELNAEVAALRSQLEAARQVQDDLRGRVETEKALRVELLWRLERWLDQWEVEVVELTAYAPLDPRAVAGVCYEGDPGVTSSGAPVVIGETAAACPDVPFGARVWLGRYGFRRVTDRGGAVNRNVEGRRQVDVAVATQEEAHALGRRAVLAVWERWDSEGVG